MKTKYAIALPMLAGMTAGAAAVQSLTQPSLTHSPIFDRYNA